MGRVAAGRLTQRVRIQKPAYLRDDHGQQKEHWVDVATVWAHVKTMVGSAYVGMEFESAGAEVSRATTSIRIRRRRDITHDMRVLYDGRTYRITAVLPDDENRDSMYLACVIVSSGAING